MLFWRFYNAVLVEELSSFFSFAISGDLSSLRHMVVLFIFIPSSRFILRHPTVEFGTALIILRLSLMDNFSERPVDFLWP